MAVKQLADGNTDGTVLGQSTTDKVGFWGKTPVVQPSGATIAALTAGETTAANVAAAVVNLYTVLKGAGLIA